MKINRRALMASIPLSMVAAPSLLATETESSYLKSEIQKVKDLFTSYYERELKQIWVHNRVSKWSDYDLVHKSHSVSHHMVDIAPALFIGKTMRGPVDVLDDNKKITTSTRSISKTINAVEFEKIDDKDLASFMVDNVLRWKAPYESAGKDMFFYSPIEIQRCISPETFEPAFGFKTRYGFAEKGRKIVL